MTHIPNLFDRVVEKKMTYIPSNTNNRIVEAKMLKHQKIVDRINNRHNEQIPGPLFWIAVLCVMVLLTSGVMG